MPTWKCISKFRLTCTSCKTGNTGGSVCCKKWITMIAYEYEDNAFSVASTISAFYRKENSYFTIFSINKLKNVN